IRLKEETYGSLLRMALGLARLAGRFTRRGEVVGVVMPNAAPTLGLILGLSGSGRVPALLNYTAGVDGVRAACAVAKIHNVVASRTFLEKARLGHLLEGIPDVQVHYLEDLKGRLGLMDKLWVLGRALFSSLPNSGQSPDDPAVVLFTSGSEG